MEGGGVTLAARLLCLLGNSTGQGLRWQFLTTSAALRNGGGPLPVLWVVGAPCQPGVTLIKSRSKPS